tara:strand:+ start:584 stop:826 length:243 start_codon:yes stop_codon:yes gene_type:complete
MFFPTGYGVKYDGTLGGRTSFSGKSEVLLSPIGGGCGREIPHHKDDDLKSIERGRIWCGMESSAMPGLFFTCYECYHERH